MPSSAEKSRERVKKWKKENPEKVKEQRKRHRMRNAKKNYQRVKTWRQKNPEKRRLQKQRERHAKKMKEFECSNETIDHNRSLPNINFDCLEAIAAEQQDQDFKDLEEVIIALEYQQDLITDFDLSLLDV